MPLPDFIRRRVYGRTLSEQKVNAEDEAWASPRGKGASAKDGKDGIAREQFAAKRLNELGYPDKIKVETHDGGRLGFNPLGRDEQYDRIAPGYKYDEGRRSFLRKAMILGGAGAAILAAANSKGIADFFTRDAKAAPGAGQSGTTLSPTDIDAKRIGGVRYATEFDTAKHAGTVADPWTDAALRNAISDIINNGIIAGGSGKPGGRIFNAAGNYAISQTIDISNLFDTTFEGATIDATSLQLSNLANRDMFSFSNPNTDVYFITIRDMTLNGNKANNTSGRGIFSQFTLGPPEGALNDLFLEHIFAKNFAQSGIETQYGWGWRLYGVISEFNTLHGLNYPNVAGTNMDIVNSKFGSNGQDGIIIARPQCSIANTILNNNGNFGLHPLSSGSQGLSVTGCTIINNAQEVVLDQAAEVMIHGNLIGAGTTRALWLFKPYNCRIYGNRFLGSGKLINVGATFPSGNLIRDNSGLNPFGLLATPFDNVNATVGLAGVSATLTSATVYSCDYAALDIYWTGGTVSAQTKNATAIPQAVGGPNYVHLEIGDTYSITFTVTPTTFVVFAQ